MALALLACVHIHGENKHTYAAGNLQGARKLTKPEPVMPEGAGCLRQQQRRFGSERPERHNEHAAIVQPTE